MIGLRRSWISGLVVTILATAPTGAWAAACGNSAAGYEAWKAAFTQESRGRIGAAGLAALQSTSYSYATIGADRGHHGFNMSLEQFMAKRGANAVVSQGRSRKQSNAALFESIRQRYGVPPGPLLAIWGMESGFGAVRGHANVISAVATLAYDCRRSEYFTDQLNAALKLVDQGTFNAGTIGSTHGEVGQTQFMPKNVLLYSTGNMETPAGALTSTANFLKAHGWRAGAGYGPGEPNFAAIQAWNAATVYQRALAIMGQRIDSGEY